MTGPREAGGVSPVSASHAAARMRLQLDLHQQAEHLGELRDTPGRAGLPLNELAGRAVRAARVFARSIPVRSGCCLEEVRGSQHTWRSLSNASRMLNLRAIASSVLASAPSAPVAYRTPRARSRTARAAAPSSATRRIDPSVSGGRSLATSSLRAAQDERAARVRQQLRAQRLAVCRLDGLAPHAVKSCRASPRKARHQRNRNAPTARPGGSPAACR